MSDIYSAECMCGLHTACEDCDCECHWESVFADSEADYYEWDEVEGTAKV